MGKTTDPLRFLPLKPLVFMALLALREEPRHGYGIKKQVEARSEGHIILEAGTLYRLMARLLKEGLVAESPDRPEPALDDERRRYYELTPFGREVLTAEAKRLAQLVASPDVTELATEGKTP